MITKKRLLDGLNELVYVEEGMVTMFTNFDKALVNLTEELDKDKKKKMNVMLSKLHNDSARHKEMIENMITQVEGVERNKY